MENRLCPLCNVVDDEEHLLMSCDVNKIEREELYNKVSYFDKLFIYYNTDEKFIFLMTSNNPYILSWLGKFIYLSLKIGMHFYEYYNSLYIHFFYLSIS